MLVIPRHQTQHESGPRRGCIAPTWQASAIINMNPVIPHLPPEIECIIFEIAAQSAEKDVTERVNLLLVAKRVQGWVESIIYQSAMYRLVWGPGSGRPTVQQTHPRVPISKFHLVHHLSFAGMDTYPESLPSSILQACSNLTTLSCWCGTHASFIFRFVLDGNLPFLKRLSIWLADVSPELYNGPDAPRRLEALGLTHLEFNGRPLTPTMYSFLAHLSHLTHLCFSITEEPPSPVISYILTSSWGHRLKVVVVTKFQGGNARRQEYLDKYEEIGIDDLRFVYSSQSVETHMEDRLDAMMDKPHGIWKFAENIIEERKIKKGSLA